jgi:hypothetical protein
MKHIAIYEEWAPRDIIDLFGLEFTMVLENRTVIKGPLDSENAVKEIFGYREKYKDFDYSMISQCYRPFQTRYTLDESEVKRAECAEKNLREFLGNRLDELDCDITYYRPMYIHRRMAYKPIVIYAPGANWGSGNEFKAEANFYNKNDGEGPVEMPKIIEKAKEFAAKHKVTHVLPHGPNLVTNPRRKEYDKYFIHIEDFKWEDYYW